MAGGGAALYGGGGTLAVSAEEEGDEENDEHAANAGNRVKDVTTRASRALLPREAPQQSVTRMRNPCVPI
jgi:hypothetical protein